MPFKCRRVDITKPHRLHWKCMQPVFAAVNLKSTFPEITRFDTVGSIVSVVVSNAFVIAGVVFFILLIFGGFSVIASAGSGDTKGLERARGAIVGAVTGLILVIGSFWIIQIVELVTGISILHP